MYHIFILPPRMLLKFKQGSVKCALLLKFCLTGVDCEAYYPLLWVHSILETGTAHFKK